MLTLAELQHCCVVQWLHFAPSHPALPGHFPGRPVIPGVILLERIEALLQDRLPQPFVLHRLPVVKFLRPVLPDEALQLGIEFTGAATSQITGRFTYRTVNNAQLLAQGSFVLQAATAS